jgi:glycosyltransferase involved in cell wall biosynthesis
MRLLVVGHTYVTSFSQSKYVAMKKLEPSLQLCLIVPRQVTHVFMNYKAEINPGLEPEEVVSLPAILNRSHMTRILHPARLANLMRTFNPDHIHIEEDPHSLVGVETVFITQRVCPRATISFFIWDNLARTPRFPLSLIKRLFTRYSFRRCGLVVCGNGDAQRLLTEDKGYTGPSLVLPQVGLDPDEYMAPLQPNLPDLLGKHDDRPLIGFLGRLVPEKGVLLLLEALSRLHGLECQLLLVGNGPLRETIRNYWRNTFGDRLIRMDAIPHKAISQYLRCLDVFVLPSYSIPTWKEQFGLTLAQAMMAGVACIGSSSGAIPEVLGPGGLIFKERDVDDLTCALKRVLESEELRRELGGKARAFALQRYSNAVVASAYLVAFKNLIVGNIYSGQLG